MRSAFEALLHAKVHSYVLLVRPSTARTGYSTWKRRAVALHTAHSRIAYISQRLAIVREGQQNAREGT